MSKMSNELEEMPDGIAKKMFPDRPTDEVVAEIVAQDPRKHGVTVEERKRRALEAARAEARALDEFFAEDQAVGGKPDEAAPIPGVAGVAAGTQPGAHEAGGLSADHSPGERVGGGGSAAQEPDGGGDHPQTRAARADDVAVQDCAAQGHPFPDDATAETPCPVCGITFEAWVNS